MHVCRPVNPAPWKVTQTYSVAHTYVLAVKLGTLQIVKTTQKVPRAFMSGISSSNPGSSSLNLLKEHAWVSLYILDIDCPRIRKGCFYLSFYSTVKILHFIFIRKRYFYCTLIKNKINK